MTRNAWVRGLAAAGLGLLASVGGARAQAPAPAIERAPGDLPGPIDNLQDIQDTARMLFKLADTNNDGQISQKEANDAGNLMVGGFFFRADTNGDGTLSKEEAQAAREALYQQKPYLRVFAERAKNQAKAESGGSPAAVNPAQAILSVLDSNSDQKIQAGELRQAVQTGVTAFYAAADTNRDGQLSPTEINAAGIGMARSAAQAAFQAADADRDGQLSRAEFDKALVGPANTLFAVIDINGDGKISEQEAQAARQFMMMQAQKMMMPEAPNSARNLIKTGQTPDQVAPVPNFNPGVRPAPAPR